MNDVDAIIHLSFYVEVNMASAMRANRNPSSTVFVKKNLFI